MIRNWERFETGPLTVLGKHSANTAHANEILCMKKMKHKNVQTRKINKVSEHMHLLTYSFHFGSRLLSMVPWLFKCYKFGDRNQLSTPADILGTALPVSNGRQGPPNMKITFNR